MGGHVSRLKRRVHNVGNTHKQAMAGYAPVPGGAAQTSGGAASPSGAPGVMPLAQVTVYPEPGPLDGHTPPKAVRAVYNDQQASDMLAQLIG